VAGLQLQPFHNKNVIFNR